MTTAPINLVVALPAEAKPLISGFEMRREMPDRGFPVYRRESLYLIASGVGKTASAAATAFLHAVSGFPEDAIWLNIGIAGHARHATGTARLANCVTDANSGLKWEPSILIQPPVPTDALITLDRPDFDYKRTEMFDMESSGFFPTARRFTRPELVHCFKIISDNRRSSAQAINNKRVSGWIEGQLQPLSLLIERLRESQR